MRRTATRMAAFVVAVALGAFVLLLWAAHVRWNTPWAPDAQRQFAGDQFAAVFGTADARDGHLHVATTAEDFSAVQSVALPNVDAANFPILRYRFADFPRTLELSLVFRTAEQPGDVQTIALPWPGRSTSTFDLSRVPDWHGTITELGFAEFATAQNVPPPLGFKPFEIVEAELWSASWRGDLAALTTDWFGAWPWSQRSVHALGREGSAPPAFSAVLFAALVVVIAAACAMLLFGLRDRRWPLVVLASAALAWLALDLRWQSGLVHRLLATRTLYAGLDWPARARIVGDSDVLDAADDVRKLLRGAPVQKRILVEGSTRYESLRLMWHLLPLNVGEFMLARAFGGSLLPEGSYIVFLNNDSWYSDPALRELLAHSERLDAADARDSEGNRLAVFRYRRDN